MYIGSGRTAAFRTGRQLSPGKAAAVNLYCIIYVPDFVTAVFQTLFVEDRAVTFNDSSGIKSGCLKLVVNIGREYKETVKAD